MTQKNRNVEIRCQTLADLDISQTNCGLGGPHNPGRSHVLYYSSDSDSTTDSDATKQYKTRQEMKRNAMQWKKNEPRIVIYAYWY